jgi:nitroreductase
MKLFIKQATKKILGNNILVRVRFILNTMDALTNYWYDFGRYIKSSLLFAPEYDQEMLGAIMMMECHRIEKGLSLPAPRSGFGLYSVRTLIRLIPEFENRFGAGLPAQASREALKQYHAFHSLRSQPMPPELSAFLEEDMDRSNVKCEAGVKEVHRSDIVNAAKIDFDAFANSRYSVRQFTGEMVAKHQIMQAIKVATKSPSVCNRQSVRLHLAIDKESIASALSYQNGNEGFGHNAGALLIITSDMKVFKDVGERNQCWIDGGIFSMSLCYALHAQGLGTCMLNWSQRKDNDILMRTHLGIPANEAVVMMLAAGHLPEKLHVAISPRFSPDSIVRILN